MLNPSGWDGKEFDVSLIQSKVNLNIYLDKSD